MANYALFPNGTALEVWLGRNCDQCTKQYDDDKQRWPCHLEMAIDVASGLDGRIQKEWAVDFGQRMKWDGQTYLTHDCPERQVAATAP